MAVHDNTLRFSVTGVDASTGKVIQFSDALGRTERQAAKTGVGLRSASGGFSVLAAATESAAASIQSTTQRIGPAGAALVSLARSSTYAAQEQALLATRTGGAGLAMGIFTAGVATAGIAAAAYSLTLVDMADRYTALSSRIRIYSTDAANAMAVETALFAVARETRSSVEATVTLYARLAPAFKDLGRSQQDTLTFTTLVGKALASQGASAQEASAGTVQLAQAISSGVLRGDEFKSLMEAFPGLMRRVAEGIGVPVGALRAMAENGELTAKVVTEAIFKMQGAIEGDFANAPKTVAQSFQVLSDAILRAVGIEAKASGSQAALATALLAVADSVDEVIDGLKAAGVIVGTVIIGQMGGAGVAALIALAIRLRDAAIASAMFGGALAGPGAAGLAGFRAAASGMVAFLGGPWGVAIAAAGLAVYGLTEYQKQLNTASDDYEAAASGAANAAMAYADAANVASMASGANRESALKEAAAYRELAMQARNAAEQKLNAARATIASLTSQNAEAIKSDRFNFRGDRPGSIRPAINAPTIAKNEANAAAALAALSDADKRIADADKALNVRSGYTPPSDDKKTKKASGGSSETKKTDTFASDLEAILARLGGTEARALKQYAEDTIFLQKAFERGAISAENYAFATKKVNEALNELSKPDLIKADKLDKLDTGYTQRIAGLDRLIAQSEALAKLAERELETQIKLAELRGDTRGADALKRSRDIQSNAGLYSQAGLSAADSIGKATQDQEAQERARVTGVWREGVRDGIRAAWDGNLNNFLADRLNKIADDFANKFADGIAEALSQGFAAQSKSGSGGFVSGLLNFGASLFTGGKVSAGNTPKVNAPNVKFANGGIMTEFGSVPLRAYARGGIANSPQMAMFGEGSRPEAYVPLPDGRSIPVTMQGGGGVTVNVINPASKPTVRDRGNGVVDVIFARMDQQDERMMALNESVEPRAVAATQSAIIDRRIR